MGNLRNRMKETRMDMIAEKKGKLWYFSKNCKDSKLLPHSYETTDFTYCTVLHNASVPCRSRPGTHRGNGKHPNTPAGPAQSTPRWAAILPHSAGQVPLSSSSSSNLVLFNADVRYYGKVCCLIFLWQNFPLHAVL